MDFGTFVPASISQYLSSVLVLHHFNYTTLTLKLYMTLLDSASRLSQVEVASQVVDRRSQSQDSNVRRSLMATTKVLQLIIVSKLIGYSKM
jgi:hypothetical protein